MNQVRRVSELAGKAIATLTIVALTYVQERGEALGKRQEVITQQTQNHKDEIDVLLVEKRRLNQEIDNQFRERFGKVGIENLTAPELKALVAAWNNFSDPDVKKRGLIPDFMCSPFHKLENTETKPKFALDPNAFQIMRVQYPTRADSAWQRFGLERKEDDSLIVFARPEMFKDVDLAQETPEVAKHLNQLWKKGTRVVALLGAARVPIEDGMLMIEPVQKVVSGLNDVAYMTGGYRGQGDNKYGITRAGFDVPKSMGRETLVIMPTAGAADSHQTPTSRSFYGTQWGDDTPALAKASDAAIFFRNIPEGRKYGAWTEVEIANFVHLGKPLVILDPESSKATETLFGQEVHVFKDPGKAVAYINKLLPDKAALANRRQLGPIATTRDDRLANETNNVFDDWMAVRLMFKNQRHAMWVYQKNVDTFLSNGLDIPKGQECYSEDGRNLVLDGYWKDIMLLQQLHKLPEDAAMDELVQGYATYRKQIVGAKGWHGGPKIGGIWFLYKSEHDPGFIESLEALPQTDYKKKLERVVGPVKSP